MPLYRITTKLRRVSNGMIIEKGMSVQMASLAPNIVTNAQLSEQLNTLFKNAYGVDLKKMGALNSSHLHVEKIG